MPIADLAAYRVVQEALTNAYKHGAGSADLRIVDADPTVVIEVTNPVTGAAVAGSGLGLVGMRERVLASGGHLEAGPDGAGAFRVRVELPASSRAAS